MLHGVIVGQVRLCDLTHHFSLSRFWPFSVLSIFRSVNPKGNPKKIKKEQEMDLKETIAVDCIKQEVNDVPEVESESSNHSEKDEKICFEMLPIEKCENQEIGDITEFKSDCSREMKIEEEECTSLHLPVPDVSQWQTGLSVEENNKYKSDYEDIRNNTFSHSDSPSPCHERRKSNVNVVVSNSKVPKDSSLSCGKPTCERSTTSECVDSSQYLECISASSEKDFQLILKSQTPNCPFQCEICNIRLFTSLNVQFSVSPWETGYSLQENYKYKSDYEDIRNNTLSYSDCLNPSHDRHNFNVNVVIIPKDSSLSYGKLNFESSTTSEIVNSSQYLEVNLASSEKPDFQQLLKSQTPNHPFLCKICRKSFTCKTDLKRHLIIHTSRRYQCKMCSICFNQKSNLDRHMYTHTGKHPFHLSPCIKQEVNDVPEVESEYSNHSEKDEKIHFEMLPIEKCENQVSPWQTGLSVEENNKYKSDYEDIRSNTLSHSDCPNPHVVDSNAKVPKDSSLSCGKPNSERSTTSECVESSQYLECISASSDKEDFHVKFAVNHFLSNVIFLDI
ncbi:hypothetical protein C0J52_21527 [Blattella germanica]|nr:hypothetical protein C0J52_21527 [Blattella germanica]